jgi:hypothetical protein
MYSSLHCIFAKKRKIEKMNENTADILKYSQFWNKNLQEIEDIKQSLKKRIKKN